MGAAPKVHAFERWLKHFPDYQRRWMFERSRFAVSVKARQIGLSTATAAKCVFRGLTQRRNQLIVSASQPLSDEVLKKARWHCEVLAAGGLRAATDFVANNTTTIEWRSGGRIISLPSNPRTARGFAGDVYLDEYAYHLDPEGITDAVRAMAIRGDFCLNIFSTPNGMQGEFAELVHNPPKGWALHSISIKDAIRDGFRVNLDELFQTVAGGDERLFNQWFNCEFLDADLQYYPSKMVDAALGWSTSIPRVTIPALDNARIFAGLDVGREHDLTALTVVAVVDNVVWHLATMTCQRTKFAEQKALIRRARQTFGWKRLFIDQTGIGNQLAEELVEEFGVREAIPMTFTNAVKEDLATRGLRWLRDGRVRLARGTEGIALAREAKSLRRKVTEAGHVSYDVPRSKAGHGDRLWSFLLALWGAGEPVAPRGMGQSPLLAVA